MGCGRGNDIRYPNKASLFADTAIHVAPKLALFGYITSTTPHKNLDNASSSSYLLLFYGLLIVHSPPDPPSFTGRVWLRETNWIWDSSSGANSMYSWLTVL